MKNTAQTALEMIAAGHSVETVMNITGLDPDELMDILDIELGIKEKVIVVEHVLQVVYSPIHGELEFDMN